MIGKGSLVLLLGCLTAVPALAGPQCDSKLGAGGAVFCNGAYALCIKALCKPVAGSTDTVSCDCVVEQGWSMGPAACTDPGRSQTNPPPAGASLMSTYSNYFNTSEKTQKCTSSDTRWAWCYGAPCTVDKNDPKHASCTCPVCTSAANTLGGGCHPDACKLVYSAATPINDAFANLYYFEHLKKQGIDVPGPAKPCIPPAPPAH
jgi:hypothetical protein